MPISDRHDELDMFAATVNFMMDEVERLMSEVKGATETIAHDLRTPLTRARAQLHRLQQAERVGRRRHRPRDRRRSTRCWSGFAPSCASPNWRRASAAPASRASIWPTSSRQVVDLYRPLAEAGGVRLSAAAGPGVVVEADPKLLFEAVSNLVDNAIKFAGKRRLGRRCVSATTPARPGSSSRTTGLASRRSERAAVLQRFYRGERDRLIARLGPGSQHRLGHRQAARFRTDARGRAARRARDDRVPLERRDLLISADRACLLA